MSHRTLRHENQMVAEDRGEEIEACSNIGRGEASGDKNTDEMDDNLKGE